MNSLMWFNWKYTDKFFLKFSLLLILMFFFLFEICGFLSVVQLYRLKLRQLVPIYSILCICYTVISYSIGKFEFKMFFFSAIFYSGYTFFIQWWWVFFFFLPATILVILSFLALLYSLLFLLHLEEDQFSISLKFCYNCSSKSYFFQYVSSNHYDIIFSPNHTF